MKKIKIEKLDLSDFIWGEKDKYNKNNPAPNRVSRVNIPVTRYENYDYQKQFTGDLDKLITELENVKVRAEDVMKISIQDVSLDGEDIMVPFKDWENGLWEDQRLYGLHHTKRIPDKPIDWGDGNAYVNCRSFADITILNTGPYNEPYETDFYYSTPEVIQVLKQWRDYEEKTVKEELEKEKTKPKKTFVDKLLGK